jgi:hypothetical protein
MTHLLLFFRARERGQEKRRQTQDPPSNTEGGAPEVDGSSDEWLVASGEEVGKGNLDHSVVNLRFHMQSRSKLRTSRHAGHRTGGELGHSAWTWWPAWGSFFFKANDRKNMAPDMTASTMYASM